MKRKNMIISVLIFLLLLEWIWFYYFTVANDDATCYSYYVKSVSSCYSNEKTCSARKNWVKVCDGVNYTTYWETSYRCSRNNVKRKNISSPEQWVCSVEFTDNITPWAEWWIE